jgi:Ni/Co efflux regulator RcnB
MRTYGKSSLNLCVLALGALLAAAPAIADKPSWAGGGNDGKHGNKHSERDDDRGDNRSDRHRDDRQGGSIEFRFGDDNRRIVNDYYGTQFRAGNCPPGLAKKNNGCLPPGQAKKWNKGQPLPGDLRYYDLPRDLVIRLPTPPSGHRYVRVASDILLIAVGSSMVIDAIEDIGR